MQSCVRDCSKCKPVATRKKKVPAKQRKRRWLIPKLLLLLACAALVVFIGVVFQMEREVRRIGLFGGESAAARPPARSQTPLPEATAQGTQPLPAAPEEITPDDKKRLDDKLKQLDDKLRAREGRAE